jgi:hypothetical protein
MALESMYYQQRNRSVPVAALFVCFFEITFGKMNPNAVDKIVITTRALKAPARTMPRECRIARRAAMMNVSSPTCNTKSSRFP